ncbi:hypothetical protein CVT26_001944 [Gymnopilus dilepis]|uniref:GST N-terminal domain-containing protein n=1 Tax=Gymnopilus dilepis TaxID=231916 RepID=A0A409WE82_9AGAR|nr:hypothetical protein CVT26_001944 [Gymnopilus dilepis]
MTIIFYDIPSATPEKSWSANLWRTRFHLNYKGLSYKTEWVEYPDIEPHCIKYGIEPTSNKPDGTPFYTLPAIHDPSTGIYLSDSFKIAEYLDKTYPDTPLILPNNTHSLQIAFSDAFTSKLDALWAFILPVANTRLNPASEVFFRRTREAAFGKKLEDVIPTGEEGAAQWAKFKAALGDADRWYAKSPGPFLLGDKPSWGDFVAAGYAIWWKIIFGEDSEQWKDIASWHGGRWKDLVDNLKEFILNYKGVPYKTEWVEYPDIAPLCKKLGIPPTTKPDGSLWYTLPAIYDPSTKTYVSDSIRIAEYLDKRHPETPKAFPHNTEGLQIAFTEAFTSTLVAPYPFVLPAVFAKLNPPSQEHFRYQRHMGKTVAEMLPSGEEAKAGWAKFESELGKIDEWLVKGGGKYLLGDKPSWGDFLVASYLIWFKVSWGEDSKEWKDICSWHDGRWKTRLDNLKEFILNHKSIPYKTEWVEYPDIEPLCMKLGIAPTHKEDGSLWYTLPAIYDPSTDTYVSDSLPIAEYLEKTYPDTPSIFPHNTYALQVAFTEAWQANLTAPFVFMLPLVHSKLNSASQRHFRRTREVWFGKKIEELTPSGDEAIVCWGKFETELGNADDTCWEIDQPSWVDFLVGSYLLWFKRVLDGDKQRWKDVEAWHGGRWKERLDNLKEYLGDA